MEDSTLEKKENEVTNNNQNSSKNCIIAILLVIIVALVGAVIYFAFIKKDSEPVDNGGDNNKTSIPVEPENTAKVSRKMVFNRFNDSCANNIVETFNGIKVEIKNAKETFDGCEGEIYINDSKITDFDNWGIYSIEIYDTYVIIDGGTSGGGSFVIYDTENNNKALKPDLGEYFQEQDYISSDDGLVIIASSHAGEYGAKMPEHDFRKLQIKYVNGIFSIPEIIEEYDEYRELVK